MSKRAKRIGVGLFLLAAMGLALPYAFAATDAFFGGRSLRMTRISAGKCTDSAYSCLWFDTVKRMRFWNGSNDLYTPNANMAVPTSGKYVLVTDTVDGGAKWIPVTDGGLVLP